MTKKIAGVQMAKFLPKSKNLIILPFNYFVFFGSSLRPQAWLGQGCLFLTKLNVAGISLPSWRQVHTCVR
jgi:hypothetical protein